MSFDISFDELTGTFEGRFVARVEGGEIVFTYDINPRGENDVAVPWSVGGSVNADLETFKLTNLSDSQVSHDEKHFTELANVVRNLVLSRTSGEMEAGQLLTIRHTQPQHVIRSETTLLKLASEIGPLFGRYDMAAGGCDGYEVREPVSAWIAAAGVALLASRLEEFKHGNKDVAGLNDDLLFYVVRLANNGRPWFAWEASYLFDGGIPTVYRLLLQQSKGYDRFIESTFNRVDGTIGSVQSSADYFPQDSSQLLRAEPTPGDTDNLVLHRATNGLERLRCFHNVDMEMPDGFPAIATFSFDGMTGDDDLLPIAKSLCRDFLDELFAFHQKGKLSVARPGRQTSWSYNSALERIWSSYGSTRETRWVGICKFCGQAFMKQRRDQEYCPDPGNGLTPCRTRRNDLLKQARRSEYSSVKKQVIYHTGETFGAKDIYRDLNGALDLATIIRCLKRMSEDVKAGLVPVGTDGCGTPVYHKSQ